MFENELFFTRESDIFPPKRAPMTGAVIAIILKEAIAMLSEAPANLMKYCVAQY